MTVTSVLLLGIVACGDKPQAPAVSTADTHESAEGVSLAPPGVNTMLEKPLPEGVEIFLPVQLRRDRMYVDENGEERRRVVLDLMESDTEATLSVIEEAYVKAGFQSRGLREMPNGGSQMKFRKKDFGVAVVTVRPDWGDEASDSGKYIVVLDWRPLSE